MIFNALIIIALVPLALKGVKYRAIGASRLLQRNLLIYGLGGLVAPFVGIKIIDLLITAVGVAVHGVLEIVFLAITLPFRLLAAPFRI